MCDLLTSWIPHLFPTMTNGLMLSRHILFWLRSKKLCEKDSVYSRVLSAEIKPSLLSERYTAISPHTSACTSRIAHSPTHTRKQTHAHTSLSDTFLCQKKGKKIKRYTSNLLPPWHERKTHCGFSATMTERPKQTAARLMMQKLRGSKQKKEKEEHFKDVAFILTH